MFGATRYLMSGSGVTSADADLVYSGGPTGTQFTYSNTKGRNYGQREEPDTEDEMRKLANKSDVSLSSFSNLAKEL